MAAAEIAGNGETRRQLAVGSEYRGALEGEQNRSTDQTGLDEFAARVLESADTGFGRAMLGRIFGVLLIHPKPLWTCAGHGARKCSIGGPGFRLYDLCPLLADII